MHLGVWEIVIIVLLVVVLFGSAKIPAMMKNVASGVKVFKQEMKTEEKPATPAKKATKKAPAKKKTK